MRQFKFTKKEIEDYLRNEVRYQDCKIKEILELYNNKKLEKYYKPPESFQQIKALIKISKDFENIFVGETGVSIFNRLMEILTRNLGYKFYVDLVGKLNSQNFTDDRDIFMYIKNKLTIKEYKYLYSTKKICNNRKILADQFHWKINKYLEDEKNYKYLDIGFGDGGKTKEIAKKFGIDIKNTYGIEIKDDFDEDTDWRKNINFSYSIVDYQEKYPYPDNYFFFATALMSLHHSKDLDFTLREINRVIKKDGYILIQEHDNFSIVDNMIADLVHTWWITFNSVIKKKKVNFNVLDKSIYYCWYEWDLILKEYGFQYITSAPVSLSIKESISASRPYFFLCQKVRDL